MKKVEILKFQIRSAQNVGKVWISWNKILLATFGAISGQCCTWAKQLHLFNNFYAFPLANGLYWGNILWQQVY